MNNSPRVRGFQRFTDLQRDGYQVIIGNSARGDALSQRLPLEQFHDEERLPSILTYVMNSADIRMVQRGNGPGFALKTFESNAARGVGAGEKLQSNVAVESGISGAEYRTHSTGAKSPLDLVRSHLRTPRKLACFSLHFAVILAGSGVSRVIMSSFVLAIWSHHSHAAFSNQCIDAVWRSYSVRRRKHDLHLRSSLCHYRA